MFEHDFHPPHKSFGGLTEKVKRYDGQENIMVMLINEASMTL